MPSMRLSGRQVMEHCGRGPEPITPRHVAVEVVRFVLAAVAVLCLSSLAFFLVG